MHEEIALQIFLPKLPEIQIVPEKGDFEYDKVPYSNLVARRRNGLDRDQVHLKMKARFEDYPGAKAAARVAKALFIPLVAGLPKQPWSLMLTHMLYREASREHSKKSHKSGADFGGVDLFRLLLRDLGSWPSDPASSSVGMVARWANNPEHKAVKEVVNKALEIWAEAARQITHCHMSAKISESQCWAAIENHLGRLSRTLQENWIFFCAPSQSVVELI